MSCISNDSDEYVALLNTANASVETNVYVRLEKLLLNHVIVGICGFGLIGNMLNLIALASIIVNKPMDRMERSATVGLLALAASDLLFCAAVIPYSVYDFEKVLYEGRTFLLMFHLHNGAVISTLVTASTWLTVVMAVSRYLAICRPLEARVMIGMRYAKASIFTAFVFSFLLNLPKFWHLSYVCLDPPPGEEEENKQELYMATQGFLQQNKTLGRAYYASYLVVGILAPLIVLAYCNFFLIRALRKSSRMRSQLQANCNSRRPSSTAADPACPSAGNQAQRASETPKRGQTNVGQTKVRQHETGQHKVDTTNTITLTLTIIVIMYAVLVLPAETSNIFTSMVVSDNLTPTPVFSFAVTVANTLQTINFSFNFVLYCVINVHFRRIIHAIITCQAWRRRRAGNLSRRQDARGGSPTELDSDVKETFMTPGARGGFNASPRCNRNNVNVRYASCPAGGDSKETSHNLTVVGDGNERCVVAEQLAGQDGTISFNRLIENTRYN